MGASFGTGIAGCGDTLEGTRWPPGRADAQTSGTDLPGWIRLRSHAPHHELAMLDDRPIEVEVILAHQAALELAREDLELPRGGAPHPPTSACEAVPGPCKGEEVRARSPTVRGEHRAHASAAVHVGARDDALARSQPLEHRAARGCGQAVDRATELIHGLGAGVMTVCHRL